MTYHSEKETEEYLDRLGLGESVSEGIDIPQVMPDEWINNLHGRSNLDRFNSEHMGLMLNTECGFEELVGYIQYLKIEGILENLSVESEQPVFSYSMLGNPFQVPGIPRRKITLTYSGGTRVEYEVEQWTPHNVRMMMVSWERPQFGLHVDY